MPGETLDTWGIWLFYGGGLYGEVQDCAPLNKLSQNPYTSDRHHFELHSNDDADFIAAFSFTRLRDVSQSSYHDEVCFKMTS